jgi:Ni/Co efflux regulator RcnB
MTMRILLALTAAALLSIQPLFAKPPHAEEKQQGKKEKHHKKQQHKKGGKKAHKRFSKADEQTVKSYYRNLPPGLAKKYQRSGTLPKGWESHVNSGQKLPQSYQKELQPVPKELEEVIEPGPIGSEVMRIGDKIIRLEQATGMIMDVFEL